MTLKQDEEGSAPAMQKRAGAWCGLSFLSKILRISADALAFKKPAMYAHPWHSSSGDNIIR
jgi:hypothetical protein